MTESDGNGKKYCGQSSLPPLKMAKTDVSSEGGSYFEFYNLDEIYSRATSNVFDLSLGDLDYVISLPSESIPPNFFKFASSCGSVRGQILKNCGQLFKDACEVPTPIHPVYEFMLQGSVISPRQIHEALMVARRMPNMDPLASLFVDMLKKWTEEVLTWNTDSGEVKLYLKRSVEEVSGGGAVPGPENHANGEEVTGGDNDVEGNGDPEGGD